MLGLIKKMFRYMSKKDRKIRNLEVKVSNRDKLIEKLEGNIIAYKIQIKELQEATNK